MSAILSVALLIGGLPLAIAIGLQYAIDPETGWTVGFFVLLGSIYALNTWTDKQRAAQCAQRSEDPDDDSLAFLL